MAIWNEQTTKKAAPVATDPAPKKEAEPRADFAASPSYDLPRRTPEREAKESLISADLTIEGKIEGAGHVRIAGRFNGDVHVQGNLTIESGAKLTGGVRASAVIIGGELQGNIDAASRVELLDSGVLIGDLKAGSLTVAAGSRMRGQVEFGWEDKGALKSAVKMETGSAA
ncbi:MAG TPA: polymer-forming cytoskeletal protein [Gemmatimonadales bacterium]|jgi:cytoskeletal protein CcmA (bactofilin family)|nr:polymer-forming cytoskeletal protein [Gemmatimonadales bacterium]